MLFCVYTAILFGLFISSDAYLMVIKAQNANGRDSILRGHTAYHKGGFDLRLKCSYPHWVNVSDYSTPIKWAEVKTDDKGTKQFIDRGPGDEISLQNQGSYACMPPTIHGKQKDMLENTTVVFYKASPEVTIKASPQITVFDYNTNTTDILISCNSQKSKERAVWYLDYKPIKGVNMQTFDNNSMLISKPNYRDVGVYTCIIGEDKQFVSIEGPAFIPIKHGKHEESENKIEGSSVLIEHDVYGNPYPDELIWKVSEEPDGTQTVIDQQYLKDHPNVRFSPSSNVSNGVLEMLNLDKEDRAYYSSYAKNNISQTEASFKTLIRVKGKLDALWPFLGIVAEVLILVAIILIYERRRLKREQEPEEAHDQKKPLTSTNSESIRQRKN